MKPVIYLDVLIFLNTIITFLLLLATSRMMHTQPKPLRTLLGALLGGAFSLIILAPEMGLILSVITKLLFSLIIVITVYANKRIRAILSSLGYFFSVNFIFAGIMLFISSLPSISLIQYKNGIVYMNFSFMSLLIASAMCYIITTVLNYFTRRKSADNIFYSVTITENGKSVTGKGMLDTGNSLCDTFTGEGVAIVGRKFIEAVMPDDVKQFILSYRSDVSTLSSTKKPVKLLFYNTVGGSGILPSFRVDEIKISGGGNVYILKNAEIAVNNSDVTGEYSVILHNDMLINPERRNYNVKAVK